MTKIMGAILVIGTSTLAGFIMAGRLTERCRLIRILIRIMEILHSEISYQTKMLPEIFQKTAAMIDDRSVGTALARLASAVEYGSELGTKEAWEDFVNEIKLNILTKSDCSILSDLGSFLGSTDRDDQLARLKAITGRLEYSLGSAESEQKKKVELYRYLGFVTGAVLVLWLL